MGCYKPLLTGNILMKMYCFLCMFDNDNVLLTENKCSKLSAISKILKGYVNIRVQILKSAVEYLNNPLLDISY